MCLAIPAKVKRKNKNIAEIETFGVVKKVDVSLIPEVKVGDFVIVHAGFAIQIMDRHEAMISQNYWKDLLEQENE